jgi:hypothetical protein
MSELHKKHLISKKYYISMLLIKLAALKKMGLLGLNSAIEFRSIILDRHR